MSTTTIPAPAVARSQRLALAALILGGIAIGCSPIFVRLSEVGPMATAFWRVGLAMLPLLLWYKMDPAGAGEETQPSSLGDRLALILPGLMLAGDLATWHVALYKTSVANATLFANMAPIFVTIGGWLIFRTPITRIFLAGLATSLAGVVVLRGGPQELGGGNLAGDAIAMSASVFYAGYILALGRLRSRFSTQTTLLWTTGSVAVFIAPLALFFETDLWPLTLYGWAILLGLAWFTHAAGQGLIIFALAWLPPAFSSLTLLIQPVVAAILAWVLLSEPLGAMQTIGGIIVLAGIMIARKG
jgi:drug/metabolite transporter (DMT)-like permease